MSKFALEKHISEKEEGVLYPVYKLVINDKCSFDNLCVYCKKNNLNAELNSINTRLLYIASGMRLPENKFKQLGRKKTDKIPDFEIKTKHIRVYMFRDQNNHIIAHWSTKKTQSKELNKFRIIKKSYFL